MTEETAQIRDFHNKAMNKFSTIFPLWSKDIVKWTPNKDGSAKIELSGKRIFVFTYSDDRTWKLESVRMYKKEA